MSEASTAPKPTKVVPPLTSSTPPPQTGSPRSNSRNGNRRSPTTPRDSSVKESDKQGDRRRGGSRGGVQVAARRASGGAAALPAPSPSLAADAPSEALTSLNSIITQLKDGSPVGTNSTANAQSAGSTSPARRHRKTGSSGSTSSIAPLVPAPMLTLPPSNLNPAARGFTTGGTLGSLGEFNEGLITPTASSFDMMTGMPRGAPSGRQQNDFQPARAFAFPQTPVNIVQQQQQQQQQYLLAQQQQQYLNQNFAQDPQLALAALQLQAQSMQQPPRFTSPQDETSELMAEQLAIQQQFESLRLQQENLLARFTDMQDASSDRAESPQRSLIANSPTSPGHRRIQSQQPTGAMGSFGGQGGMGNFATGPSFAGVAGAPAPALPRGHGRRHSVNTKTTASPALAASSFAQNMTPQQVAPAPTSGFGSGFQFPHGGQNNSNAIGNEYANAPDSGFAAGGPPVSNAGRRFGHSRNESQGGSMGGGWSMAPQAFPPTTAQLAEAAHHLELLAAYRAAPPGHARVPSFGMSSFVGAPGAGQLAMAVYGGAAAAPMNGRGNQQERKSLFGPYIPQTSIGPLVRSGKLVIGTLRVNKKNRSDAYVSADSLDSDIYICGSKDRNRALEGDVVAIELLNVDDVWGTKKDKEEKKRKKEESTTSDPRAARDSRKLEKKKDDVEVEGQGLMLLEEEEVTDDSKPAYAGHVVAVVERAPGQFFSGLLGILRPSSAATQQKQDNDRREREGVDMRGHSNNQPPPKIIWFRPTDKRVPLMAIPTEQAPADFIKNADKYADTLFIACIKRWPISSLHPFGILVDTLGQVGDIEAETSALLQDCNFTAEEFSESVVKCLPTIPYVIPEREYNKDVRRDYRERTVFTIDPETARDLDDALHVVKNDDGTFEVGVHIADVTHFVKANSALDREARKRCTTVYLVQRAIPMLPRLLSETLCSLTPGQDKLTFSTVFTMTAEGKVISTWFGKTIINSTVKLAYGDAQNVIDGGSISEQKIEKAVDRDLVEADIKMLAELARHVRKRRFDGGALRIDNIKVSFGLGADGRPDDCTSYQRKEANELIEEFMLMSNTAVAGKIAAGLPDQALLRRHEAPIERRLTSFIERMKRLDINLDGESAGTLMKSIETIKDPSSRMTLSHLSTKSMQRAKYFCTGTLDISKYEHYALNIPLYTHFTSPIRRYADVMVHRQLEAILAGSADLKFTMDTETVDKVARNCNVKKEAAKLAQEQSAHLFLCVLISDLTRSYGPVVRYATIIGVLDSAFDVMIPEFGIEKRVHVDQMPIEKHVYHEASNSLQLFWKKGVNVLHWLVEQGNDTHLRSVRASAENHARLMEANSGDSSAESALFDEEEAPVERKATSAQHRKSQNRSPPVFEEATTIGADHIQTVRELQTVPVVVTADMTKSPPVIKVVSLNPFV